MSERRREHHTKRPTLSSVADAAQVSTATASKVLNNRPDVAPETRRRVEAAMRDIGYEPTTGPREIRRTPVVAVVFDTLVNPYSTQILRGVLAAGKELGVDIVVDVVLDELSDSDANATDGPLSLSWIRSAAQKGWLGALVVTTDISAGKARQFREAGLHLVAIDPPNTLEDSFVSVGSTNFNGGMQATNYLLELGHRRISLAGGPLQSFVARERLHGYRSALEAADIGPREELIRHGAFSYGAGVQMGLALLAVAEPPTAVVAGCDAIALGVLESARQLGIAVPQHLSVVGFDDTPAAQSSAPPLTTVRQPMMSLGRIAVRSLLQQSVGNQPDSHHIQLATRLIQRGSTAGPAHRSVPEPAGPLSDPAVGEHPRSAQLSVVGGTSGPDDGPAAAVTDPVDGPATVPGRVPAAGQQRTGRAHYDQPASSTRSRRGLVR